MYSDTVRDHFAHPRNVGVLDRPDAVGEAKNESDGDQVQLHLRLDGGIVTDIKIKVMGCVAAIASTSLLTEMVKGNPVDVVLGISKEELTEQLGGLPPHKVRCSLTCIDALHQALEPTRNKTAP